MTGVQTCALPIFTPLWAVALPIAAVSGLVLQAGIVWVYLGMMSENVVKAVLGLWRFKSGRWIRDVTVPNL